MTSTDKVTVLIVAAGSGERMGGDVPKQYRMLAGKAVLAHAVDAMTSHPRVDHVRIVIAKGQEDLAKSVLGDRDVGSPIIGGATRADSVRKGLEAVKEGIVLVHDAARPFCPPTVIDRLLDALTAGDAPDGAVPALTVMDTLARGHAQLMEMVDRTDMQRIQTPQAFYVEDLLYAMDEHGKKSMTDESSVMVAQGLRVALVDGDERLEKLTTQADFDRAERRMAANMITKTAMGYDVHAFAGEGPIMMGGIEIAHDRGLAGHSDADVVLHSITDALLGTIGAGDIGQHFPPSDPKWKGASSDLFLAHAAKLVAEAGGVVDHVDCTVICEAPKVGPHREAMRSRVAEILTIPLASVSIKATTTEKLGFTGRGEGIAAQAIASVRLPA